MKKIFEFIGLIVLIGFSFFYTDRVMDVALEQDEIMIKINSYKDNFRIDSIDAVIDGDTIIPGINGRVVNVSESYNKMKNIGIFNENYFVFDKINPSISIYNNYDKFITKGNGYKKMVSLVFILNDDIYLDYIKKIIDEKNIDVNFFVDYNFLNQNTVLFRDCKNCYFYSYGDGGVYTNDVLLYSSNLIKRITKNEVNFCFAKNFDKSVLDVCSDNKMFTVVPSIYCKNNAYNNIKNSLANGSVILIDINKSNINNLEIIIDYINSKGLVFGSLEEVLSEELILDN